MVCFENEFCSSLNFDFCCTFSIFEYPLILNVCALFCVPTEYDVWCGVLSQQKCQCCLL